jgi:hypothetical protein
MDSGPFSRQAVPSQARSIKGGVMIFCTKISTEQRVALKGGPFRLPIGCKDA